MSLRDEIAPLIEGDVADDEATLKKFSRDTSIFERRPALVVYPKNANDVVAVVRFVEAAKREGRRISIAARSAGTDMTGGPLTDSIALVFTKYMDRIGEVTSADVRAEPGVYYRDLERETLAKVGRLIPSYPASRELCAIGGMIANNSGGELTLHWGQTRKYVRELDVVLSDGSRTTMRPLSPDELASKKAEQTLEGEIYRKVHALLDREEHAIEAARPSVSKNSAGYALWEVINKEKGTFDLSQLITGSQGTLALITGAKLGLVQLPANRAMLIVFLSDVSILPTIVERVRSFDPESFESYDDKTFRLAVRFLPQVIAHFGLSQMLRLALSFIPEMWVVMTGGVPKLVLMAEFAEASHEGALRKARSARDALRDLPLRTKIAKSETAAAKYWTVRRESFALLRKNLQGLYAAPFIDDIVVHPSDYPTFLPELHDVLSKYSLIYTIAGHIGDADFHIIPLVDLSKAESHKVILELNQKVYELVARYKGSITGEHNDGIIRTPYLSLMYGDKMCSLFAEVKNIFDPHNIFNPGKKVGGTLQDIERSMITTI